MASPRRTGKNTALAALRAVTKVISNMSQEDLEALASGKATLMLVRTEESPAQGELRRDLPFCVKQNLLAPNLSAYLVHWTFRSQSKTARDTLRRR
jgi:hypothetical protein